ncbi:hypothetical protein [Corynebacterium bovis]
MDAPGAGHATGHATGTTAGHTTGTIIGHTTGLSHTTGHGQGGTR